MLILLLNRGIFSKIARIPRSEKDDGKRRRTGLHLQSRPVRCNLNPDRGSCRAVSLCFVAVLPKSWPVRSWKE